MTQSRLCHNFSSLRQQQGPHKQEKCGCCQLVTKNDPLQSQKNAMSLEEKIYFTERKKDLEVLKEFKPESLSRSGLDAAFRAYMFGWMIRVHLYLNIPTEILHLATAYVDRYIWRTRTGPGECHLLAAAALWVAVKTSTSQMRIKSEFLCDLSKNSYTKEQLLFMEQNLLTILNFDVICPTPYTYLGIFLKICNDIPPYCTRLVNSACSYILDLGLAEYELTRFPAFLRCSAAIYLVRRILRVNGGILHGASVRLFEENVHEFGLLPLWPKELETLTGYSEESSLSSVAFIYGTLVQKAKEFVIPNAKYPTELLPIFEKYTARDNNQIAIHPITINFDVKIIFEDLLQRNNQPICGGKRRRQWSG
ncbi:cyclins [Echinococcus multilocularis]|uniref:Cyclins n=1 Tax=Echinococcus multilocularis TaxID=6211 RepID=A0A068YEX8_ECHMU|nr:cyclins [Echinococcus multilocularis]